jgi:DNA-binding Lrp family transcriptional regulator
MNLDAIDLRILDALQKDGRLANRDIAEQVGLSPSPCLRRIKELERKRIIRKYVAILDPPQVGNGQHAIVQVRLDHQTTTSVSQFEKEIARYPQVLECFFVAGDWDYILRVVARDLEDFREFCVNELAKLPGVEHVTSSICMKLVKYSTVLPLPNEPPQ